VPRPFPPVKPVPLAEQTGQSYPRLVALMRRLLEPEHGCPWDRQQSYATLRGYVLEEAAEVVDAIDRGDLEELRDELGDLLFQVVFLAQLAQAEGRFGHDDVVEGIVDKLVRRHPHVFGDVEGREVEHIAARWEAIKAAERAEKGQAPRGPLDGVPRSLPALTRAQKTGRKAAKAGFDWPDAEGPRAKVDEELAELDEAVATGDRDRIEAELGDVLFSLTNLARHHGVDAERALHRTVRTFGARFTTMEAALGGQLTTADPEAMEAAWEAAKNDE